MAGPNFNKICIQLPPFILVYHREKDGTTEVGRPLGCELCLGLDFSVT